MELNLHANTYTEVVVFIGNQASSIHEEDLHHVRPKGVQ